jgi:hypothetical protein
VRTLIAAGTAPGWKLHRLPPGKMQLRLLAQPLCRTTGSQRAYNVLERAGFGYVVEVDATPDKCLRLLNGTGKKSIAGIREAIRNLGLDSPHEYPADPLWQIPAFDHDGQPAVELENKPPARITVAVSRATAGINGLAAILTSIAGISGTVITLILLARHGINIIEFLGFTR